MADAITTVGERVAYYVGRFYPNYGPPNFNRRLSKLRVEFIEIRYGATIYPSAFEPKQIKTSTFENDTSLPAKQTFSVNEKVTNTSTYTLKESVGAKLSAKIPLPFGEAGVETVLNFESTQAQTKATEQSWAYSTEIDVAPHKKVQTSFIVQEGYYHIPFTAIVRVRGRLHIGFPQKDRHWEREISDMITDQWWPGTFEADVSGMFDAVKADKNFVVRAEEFDLGLKGVAGEPVVSYILESSLPMVSQSVQSVA